MTIWKMKILLYEKASSNDFLFHHVFAVVSFERWARHHCLTAGDEVLVACTFSMVYGSNFLDVDKLSLVYSFNSVKAKGIRRPPFILLCLHMLGMVLLQNCSTIGSQMASTNIGPILNERWDTQSRFHLVDGVSWVLKGYCDIPKKVIGISLSIYASLQRNSLGMATSGDDFILFVHELY